MKNKLLDWVDDQLQLDPTSKFILLKLALFADAENVGWAMVSVLAKGCNVSERTVQNKLKMLKEEGYIEPTGGFHTTSGKYPREVPLYRLAPRDPRFGEAGFSGAEFAPEPALGCKSDALRVQLVAPHKEPIEPTSGAIAPSERVREREAQFIELEAAIPKEMLGSTVRAKAWRVWNRLAADGVDLAKVIEAGRRMDADPKIRKRDFTLPGLERWLDEGRYRAWMPDVVQPAAGNALAGPVGPQAGDEDQAIWRLVADAERDRLGSATFNSWMGRAYLGRDAEGLVVVAATGMAKDWMAKNAWTQIRACWSAHDPQSRQLRLMSKAQFEQVNA